MWRFAHWQPNYEPARQLRLALGKSKRAKKRLVVKAARQLAVDLWRLQTGRATAQELGLVMQTNRREPGRPPRSGVQKERPL